MACEVVKAPGPVQCGDSGSVHVDDPIDMVVAEQDPYGLVQDWKGLGEVPFVPQAECFAEQPLSVGSGTLRPASAVQVRRIALVGMASRKSPPMGLRNDRDYHPREIGSSSLREVRVRPSQAAADLQVLAAHLRPSAKRGSYPLRVVVTPYVRSYTSELQGRSI